MDLKKVQRNIEFPFYLGWRVGMERGILLVNFRFRGPNHDPVPWPYFRLKYIIFRYKASNSNPHSDLVSAIHTRFCKIRIHFQTFRPKKSTSYFSPKWLKNDTLQLGRTNLLIVYIGEVPRPTPPTDSLMSSRT